MAKQKRTREAKLTAIGLAQQFDESYWLNGQTDSEAAALQAARTPGGTIQPLTDCIVARLTAAGHTVIECHGILHDADIQMVWSDVQHKEVPSYKTPHGHWVIKFPSGQGGTVKELAAAIGVEPQYIEKPGTGRYAYDNMLSYLCHVKYPDKHQYPSSEVYTAIGKPYGDYVKERWATWVKGRGSVAKKRACEGIDDLEYKIIHGEVTKGQILETPELLEIYARNRRRCADAFETNAELRVHNTIKALEAGEFSMEVYFVTGPSGNGKSYFVKHVIDELIEESAKRFGEENRWRVCLTASSNPVDDYHGEEILYMDDTRGIFMTAADWLKLLDPKFVSPISARYHNKIVACRTIFITSTKEPLEFFSRTHEMSRDTPEAMDQFLRRIASLVHVISLDETREDSPRFFKIADRVRDKEPHYEPVPSCPNSMVALHTRFEEIGEPDEIYDSATATRILTDKVMAAHGYDTLNERRAEQLAKYGLTFIPQARTKNTALSIK